MLAGILADVQRCRIVLLAHEGQYRVAPRLQQASSRLRLPCSAKRTVIDLGPEASSPMKARWKGVKIIAVADVGVLTPWVKLRAV